ncbi:MAG: amylo-alpha-1,6-glucosidase [Acidobacteriota bacterium]
MPGTPYERAEWLEADGLGGFASGTVSGIRTRRYHALLCCSRRPPVDRFVLVNGLYAWVETPNGSFPITAHRYAPDQIHPDTAPALSFFKSEPWPLWTWHLDDGTTLEAEIMVRHEKPITVLSWRLTSGPSGPVTLHVRPLLSGRDFHSLHHENPVFRFDAQHSNGRVVWHPYDSVPAIAAHATGRYTHAPDWFRRFLYAEERDRGLDCSEDLATPGYFSFDLAAGDAHLILEADTDGEFDPSTESAALRAAALRNAERRRRAKFSSRLHRAADSYLVRRGDRGRTIIAGYPWFADWGRDTFIALRGLCLATGRRRIAGDILLSWTGSVAGGLLPNRFPDRGEPPEYNTVDASLWFVLAAHEYLHPHDGSPLPPASEQKALRTTIEAILDGHRRGTRYGIRVDDDGLLFAGEAGSNLTWMDARVDAVPITPRWGKPVEIQALWLSALQAAGEWTDRYAALLNRAAAFAAKFWSPEGFLYDVVDVEGKAGAVDATLRPNPRALAAGGLPIALLTNDQARSVIDMVERHLAFGPPVGLRSLAPEEPGYAPRYRGGPSERDAIYHQGAVWPWLIGPFVEAWVKSHGNDAEARRRARIVFLDPLLSHLDACGLGHLPEIADGDAPHAPRGCPFQAWSVGEALRLSEVVLMSPTPEAVSRTQ